ncbi:MAG TPA: GNAT family N-acetyltransferase [Kouleothrix sp.]|uniref:GNAT family N-acetyltransferase n=1 Tax=Kouleothrix sp. TaxID=2779161 RepID=UPI002BB7D5A3|nr:GNAT family N-acetyltransferase [Kouleothrix sp.]HRC75604.1 GNAT family N-acetyltransferase [Kouleothrix sp.]
MKKTAAQSRARVHARTSAARAVTIRHIQHSDAELLLDMFRGLSPRTHYLRFMRPAAALSERAEREEMARLAAPGPHQITLIALAGARAVGLAQLVRDAGDSSSAEVALLIHDAYQGEGLGTTLLDLLAQSAMACGIARLQLNTLAENRPIQRAARRLGLPVASQTSAGETTLTISVL